MADHVELGCAGIQPLWQVSPGDEVHAMHPRHELVYAPQYVARAVPVPVALVARNGPVRCLLLRLVLALFGLPRGVVLVHPR